MPMAIKHPCVEHFKIEAAVSLAVKCQSGAYSSMWSIQMEVRVCMSAYPCL